MGIQPGIQFLLNKKFVRAFEHEDRDYIVLESERGTLVGVEAREDELHVDYLSGFDDSEFEEVEVHLISYVK